MKTIAEMSDLERLLCFLHGAGYCGTRNRIRELGAKEYDHDRQPGWQSEGKKFAVTIITFLANVTSDDESAWSTAHTYVFDDAGKLLGLETCHL